VILATAVCKSAVEAGKYRGSESASFSAAVRGRRRISEPRIFCANDAAERRMSSSSSLRRSKTSEYAGINASSVPTFSCNIGARDDSEDNAAVRVVYGSSSSAALTSSPRSVCSALGRDWTGRAETSGPRRASAASFIGSVGGDWRSAKTVLKSSSDADEGGER